VAERDGGTLDRIVRKHELIDHVVVLSEDHFRRLLGDYVPYYNADRVHTRLADAPGAPDSPPLVGSLHQGYLGPAIRSKSTAITEEFHAEKYV
jgi:hypothetical protein